MYTALFEITLGIGAVLFLSIDWLTLILSACFKVLSVFELVFTLGFLSGVASRLLKLVFLLIITLVTKKIILCDVKTLLRHLKNVFIIV